jgi:uncharacterized phage-associated protein
MSAAVRERSLEVTTEFTFQFQKAKAALLYLAEKRVPSLTKGKICKLIFLADRHHIVRHGRPIIGARYCALEHGPVPSQLLDLLGEVESGKTTSPEAVELTKALSLDRRFNYPHICAIQNPDLEQLSVSDIESLDDIVREYGGRSFAELRGLTHEMPAYKLAWDSKTVGANSAPMKYETFFEEEEESLVGVKEEMIENAKLRALFPEPAWL